MRRRDYHLKVTLFLVAICMLFFSMLVVRKAKFFLQNNRYVIEVSMDEETCREFLENMDDILLNTDITVLCHRLYPSINLLEVYCGKNSRILELEEGSFEPNNLRDNDDMVAVVGNDALEATYMAGEKRYIDIFERSYQVVGILKKKETERYDFRVCIPLSIDYYNDEEVHKYTIKTNVESNYEHIEMVLNRCEVAHISYTVVNWNYKYWIQTLIEKSNDVLSLCIVTIVMTLIFVGFENFCWIENEKNNFKNYRVIGMNVFQINMVFIKKMQRLWRITVSCACLIGVMINKILSLNVDLSLLLLCSMLIYLIFVGAFQVQFILFVKNNRSIL